MHNRVKPQPFQLLGRLPWNGETVTCVASGPSAVDIDLRIGKGRSRFIAVNDSWRLCPWADALYACDPQWWRIARDAERNKTEGPPKTEEFSGVRITQDWDCAMEYGLYRVTLMRKVDKILNKTPGLLGWCGNSGFHAINIAVQAGAKRILLVGYDFVKKESNYHWHGRHGHGLNNPSDGSMYKWRLCLERQKTSFEKLGVQVINCSPVSALEGYPKMSFAEAL